MHACAKHGTVSLLSGGILVFSFVYFVYFCISNQNKELNKKKTNIKTKTEKQKTKIKFKNKS